ncbi:MAG: glutathione-disulfide reductase [Hyphomicrobiaceae bacterium]
MTSFDYDLFVIGGGSGGVRAARIAATHGARVALAEEYRFGGTCVIRGCVPKKLMVYASRFHEEFEDAAGFGWTVAPKPTFQWQDLIKAKDKEINRLEGAYRDNLDRVNVEIFHERAEFADPHTIKLVASGRTVTAAKILIATGGRADKLPGVEGVEHCITSDDVFDLKEMPKRIFINGGGYIGVEFAGIFHGLGSDVTMVNRSPKLLRGFDEDMRDSVVEAYQSQGIKLLTGVLISRVEKTENGLVGHLSDGTTIEADQIMLAVGRSPNVEGLGLEAAGVEIGPGNRIVVDDEQRTSVAHIFAVGDVRNGPDLTPVAIREGHIFADREFANQKRIADFDVIPTAVFSTPEIGTVGLSEVDAREKYDTLHVYRSSFRPMKATLSGRKTKIVMKLIVDAKTDRVVGCHLFGEHSAEVIQAVAIAIRLQATKADFDQTMALHPSAAEELVTMRDFETVTGKSGV